jgi:hypothetical protein
MNNGQPKLSITKQDQEFISCLFREMPYQDILAMIAKEMPYDELSVAAKQEFIEKAPTKLRAILRQVFVSESDNLLNDLFGKPSLTKQITLADNFSLNQNVQPKKEFKYAFVNPDYAKDKYFAKPTLIGPAILTIAPTTRSATNQELVDASGQADALAIINALHNMLKADPNSLDQYKDRAIVIPVSSIEPNAHGNFFCLVLLWNGDGWNLDYLWLDFEWSAGVCVARLSQ